MKVTVQFSTLLQKITLRESIEISVSSYREIISACLNLLPQFRDCFYSQKLYKSLTLVDGDKYVRSFELDFSPKSASIWLVPTISGGVSSSFDSLGNLSLFYGASSPVSTQEVALRGIDKRIRDSALFGKASTAFDIAQRRANRDSGVLDNSEDPTRGFGSLAPMSAAGRNVPLHFGLVRTAGVVVNQYIKHIQRGGVDTIRVADYL
jgi:predicted phage tail protein